MWKIVKGKAEDLNSREFHGASGGLELRDLPLPRECSTN